MMTRPNHATVDRMIVMMQAELPDRVVSQAQFQIGATPQKSENRSYFKGDPQKANNYFVLHL